MATAPRSTSSYSEGSKAIGFRGSTIFISDLASSRAGFIRLDEEPNSVKSVATKTGVGTVLACKIVSTRDLNRDTQCFMRESVLPDCKIFSVRICTEIKCDKILRNMKQF